MLKLLEKYKNKEPEIVFEWSDQETSAKGWVVINSLRGGAAGGDHSEGGQQLLEWLDANLVDSTGHRPGVTTGSFKPSEERAWATLRKTAAEERANKAAKAKEVLGDSMAVRKRAKKTKNKR